MAFRTTDVHRSGVHHGIASTDHPRTKPHARAQRSLRRTAPRGTQSEPSRSSASVENRHAASRYSLHQLSDTDSRRQWQQQTVPARAALAVGLAIGIGLVLHAARLVHHDTAT